MCNYCCFGKKTRKKLQGTVAALERSPRRSSLPFSPLLLRLSFSFSLKGCMHGENSFSLQKQRVLCVPLSLSLLKVRVGPGGAKRSLSSDASDPAPADRKNRGPAAVSVCRVVILLPLLSLLRILHHLIR